MVKGLGAGGWGLLIVCAVSGCGGVRIEVSDATTGALIAAARISCADRVVARTGSDGAASVSGQGGRLWISADGYAPIGVDPPEHGTLRIALEPAWQERFLRQQPLRPLPEPGDPAYRPNPCPGCPR
ncbi:hypothetical protein LBMAG53_28110 [Planctomycetota bacterium]|nr:hypothetical protein LBMAG53_28110 [Planctomycetota bacterium]